MHVVEKVQKKIKGQEQLVDYVFGSGRLTTDPPEVREAKGYKVLGGHNFSIAFNDGKDKTVFYQLEFWGKSAENMAKLGFKGQLVEVCGRLEERPYEKGGEERTAKVLLVDRFTVLQFKSQKPAEQTESESSSVPDDVDVTDSDDSVTDNSVSEGSTEQNGEFDDIPF